MSNKNIDGIKAHNKAVANELKEERKAMHRSKFKTAVKKAWYLAYGAAILFVTPHVVLYAMRHLSDKHQLAVYVATAILLIPVVDILGTGACKGIYNGIRTALKEMTKDAK